MAITYKPKSINVPPLEKIEKFINDAPDGKKRKSVA